LLKELSARLTEEFGRGFSKANLEYTRRFYLEWRHRDFGIAQKPSGQFTSPQIGQTATDQLSKITQKPSAQFGKIAQMPSAESAMPAKASPKSIN
jgi:hypothetical protein